MPGPQPTPTPILEARGSWRAKNRESEPRPPVKVPNPPGWLGAEGKAEWRRMAKALEAMGVIAEIDRAALAVYCEAWETFVAARAWVEQNGDTIVTASGSAQLHPMVHLKNRSADRLAKLGSCFGWTPADRTRLPKTAPEEERTGKARFFTGKVG